MKFFIDSGDIEEIKKAASMGLLDGVTTNPSLLAKSGKPMKKAYAEICEIVDGPVSGEVLPPITSRSFAKGARSPRFTRTWWSKCRSSPRACER